MSAALPVACALCGRWFGPTEDSLTVCRPCHIDFAQGADDARAGRGPWMVGRSETYHAAYERAAADEDACPGCGCRPGEGITETCNDPLGCGWAKGQMANGGAK